MTHWSIPSSSFTLIPILPGPISHHLIWIHGDWDGQFYLVASSAFLVHNLLAILLPLFSLHVLNLPISTYLTTFVTCNFFLLRVEFVYILSTLLSIALYRSYFHSLHHFPGPFLSRLTIFHRVYLTLRSSHRHAIVLQRLHSQYPGIVRIGPNHLSILSADAIEVIHGNNSKCTKGVAYENPMGRCVNWDRDPKSHALRRRVWDRALGREARARYVERILGLAELLIERLAGGKSASIAEGKGSRADASIPPKSAAKNVSINTHIHRFAFDIMASLCFSLPSGYNQLLYNKTHPMVEIIQMYMLVGVYATMVPWLHCCVSRLWVPDALVMKWDWVFFAFARREVERRRQLGVSRVKGERAAVDARKQMGSKREKWEETENAEANDDIMAYVLSANDSSATNTRKLTTSELITDTLIMTVGGSDTTNSALVHALYRLAKHQDIQQTIYNEIIQACPSGEKLKLDMLEARNFSYLVGFINEFLRLHPPAASGLPRVIPQGGLMIDGTYVPEGTNVITPTYALQRDERYFVAAEKFIPERWTTQKHLVKDARAFCPFGIGVYGCPGKALAMMEMKIVLVSVLGKLKVKMPEGVSEEELEAKVEGEWRDCLTTQPAEIELCFERRGYQ